MTTINFTLLQGFVGFLEPKNGGVRIRLSTERGYYDDNDQWVNTVDWHTLYADFGTPLRKAKTLGVGDFITIKGEHRKSGIKVMSLEIGRRKKAAKPAAPAVSINQELPL